MNLSSNFLQAEPNSEKINKRSSLPTVIFYRVNKSDCMKNGRKFSNNTADERATSSQKNKLKSRSLSNVIRKVFACAGIEKVVDVRQHRRS